MLAADRAQALEQQLAAFERDTGHQVVVLTIPSLEGDPLEDFSIRVAEAWKIGKKGSDTGAILLIAQKERKLRIEVGYGLEGVLPDATANRIIRDVIVPRFRANDYGGGIEAGVNAILNVAKGEPLPEVARTNQRPGGSAVNNSLATTLMITVMLALFIGLTRRSIFSGAFGGAAAGAAATFFGAGGFGALLLVALALGAIVGAVASGVGVGATPGQWTSGSRYRRGGGIFPGGFGGGGFGGGGFGGGGDSGGFSGGGGGFGGGGASGDW